MKNLKIYLTAALMLFASAVILTSCKEDLPEHYVSLRIALNRTTITLTLVEDEVSSETLRANLAPDFLAKDKTVAWENSHPNVATITVGADGVVTVTAVAVGTTTITARIVGADPERWTTCVVTVLPDQATIDPGVLINGVTWATRNVAAPGRFAPTPGAPGRLYQFNRKVGYLTTGVAKPDNWDDTVPADVNWEAANDPSPPGWRVPTLEELASLFDATKVSRALATVDGTQGFRFTDIASGASLFLPASGNRVANGTFEALNDWAAYWSNQSGGTATVGGVVHPAASYWGFWTPGGGGVTDGRSPRIFANPIRSVKAN